MLQVTLDLIVLQPLARQARFHAPTTAGRRGLDPERSEWERVAPMIHTLLYGSE